MIMNKIPNSGLTPVSTPWMVLDARWMMLFPIAFALLGVLALSYGGWNLVEGYTSRHWPQCQGFIVSSTVTPHKNRFTADISYNYDVCGVTYTANRVAILQHAFDALSPAQAFIDRYPKGKMIPVFYSQYNSERAVLQPGIPGDTILLLVVGVLSLGLALPLARSYRKRRQEALSPSS